MAARHPRCRALNPKEKDYKVTDRDGMYVHVTAKGAMSFRMDCQPMSWLRSTMQPSRPSRNGHPISTAFRFRSGAKDPERNTLRNAVINWPDGGRRGKERFPTWVKSGKAQYEHMFSALPLRDRVIGRPSLWISEDFWCCASG